MYVLRRIKKERSEWMVFKGIDKYFNMLEDDVFILFNQDLFNEYKNRHAEKDVIVINLKKGYIIAVEVKSFITQHRKKPQMNSSLEKGLKQLTETKDIFHRMANKLRNDWKMISILYGTQIDTRISICEKCRPFIVQENDGPFDELLRKIIDHENPNTKDWAYASDFVNLVRMGNDYLCTYLHTFWSILLTSLILVLPTKLRIGGKTADLFKMSMNSATLDAISNNVDDASEVENIGFWSPDQFNIASNCLEFRRVLFTPFKTGKYHYDLLVNCVNLVKVSYLYTFTGYSTGKTILMVHCVQALSRRGEKVLFVSANSERLNLMGENSTQLNKLIMMFEGDDNVDVLGIDMNRRTLFEKNGKTYSDFEALLISSHNEHHIFVDELHGEEEGKEGDEPFYEMLQRWSELVRPNKHLWIVSYHAKDFSEEVVKKYFPVMPTLHYPLRNTREIVEFVKSKSNQEGFYNFHDEKMNINSIQIPSNLTKSFAPKEVFAYNFRKGFESALQILQKFCANQPAMFVIDTVQTGSGKFCTNCYDNDALKNGGDQKYLRFIEEIYTKFRRTNQLIQNIKQELVNLNSRSWLENPIGNDILVGMNNIDGFSSDILVVFQDDDPNRFEHNVCMRAKIFLIVVYIPYKPFSEFCFC